MAKINKEELLKIAQLSHIKIYDEELNALVQDIDSVLTYAARVSQIASEMKEPIAEVKNVNVLREDVVIPTPPEPILAQAPDRMHDYFVVPVIIESE